MLSVRKLGNRVETRHFIDDEHQITIGIESELWPFLQQIANANAKRNGWLNGMGSDWDYLNIWIIRRVHSCPRDIEPWQWVEKAIIDE